jgi:hypothetical protein
MKKAVGADLVSARKAEVKLPHSKDFCDTLLSGALRAALHTAPLLLVIGCQPASAPQALIQSETLQIPVEIALDRIPSDRVEDPLLQTGPSTSPILLQRAPSVLGSAGEEVFCALIPDGLELEPGQYTNVPNTGPPRFNFVESSDGRLALLEEDSPVLTYNFGIQSSSGVPEDRRRSTYIHPVYDLDGNVLTDDFPADHYHHRGLSWMWPNVWVGEARHDLWHIQGVRQQFEGWLVRDVGPVCATLGVKNIWEVEGETIAHEWVWLRAFQSNEQGRVLDLSLTWQPTRERIRLRGADDRAYGGLCFRLAPREEEKIFSPEGWMRTNSDLVPLTWADYSARFGGSDKFSGVSILQHSQNPGYPAGWCLRYYGFLGVSWPGEEIVTISPGEKLTLKFRIWIHRGNAEEGRVKEVFERM